MNLFNFIYRKSLLFDIFLIAGVLALGWVSVGANSESPPLFTPVSGAEMAPDNRSSLPIRRQQIVEVDPTVLQKKRGDINISLFPDLALKVSFSRIDEYDDGSFTWVGVIPELNSSDVTFTVKNSVLVGTVHTGTNLYKIRPMGDGLHVIEEVGPDNPIDGEPIVVHPPETGDAPQGAADQQAALADDGSEIDILVVYTPDAAASAGGTTAMEALINTAVSETNTGYANSGVTTRVRLIHQTEVDYDDSGSINTDLSRLASSSDGHMDSVHGLRDLYAADLVVLITDGNQTAYCGLAYLIKSQSPGSGAPYGFSVVAHNCATGYYSFGHEIGHNLGSAHDRDNGGSGGVYSYSYGYQDPQNDFRTIMAYNCPGNCTRVNHWSNPAVNYNGWGPTGISQFSSDSADNHLSINNNAITAANFRNSASYATPTPPPTSTPPPTATAPPTATPAPTATPSPTSLPTVVTTISAASGGSVTTSDTTLEFPGGFVNQTVALTYRALDEVDLPATPAPPLMTTQYQFEVYGSYTSNGAPASPQPGKTFDLGVDYTFYGTNHATEATLNWYFWNGVTWELANSSTVNQTLDSASALGEDFGTFALFGQPGVSNYLPITVND